MSTNLKGFGEKYGFDITGLEVKGEISSSLPLFVSDSIIVNRNDEKDEEIYNITPSLEEFVDKYYLTITTKYFDNEWMNKSRDYISKLNLYDKYIITIVYTHKGDTFVNTYLRYGEDSTELNNLIDENLADIYSTKPYILQLIKYMVEKEGSVFKPEDYLETTWVDRFVRLKYNAFEFGKKLAKSENKKIIAMCIGELANDMRRIINAAPRPTKMIKVFRGVRDDSYFDEGRITKLSGFQSTTYSLKEAINFYEYRNSRRNKKINPSILTIYIPANTPCVVLDTESHVNEAEILLIDGLELKYDEKTYKYNFMFDKKSMSDVLKNTKGLNIYPSRNVYIQDKTTHNSSTAAVDGAGAVGGAGTVGGARLQKTKRFITRKHKKNCRHSRKVRRY